MRQFSDHTGHLFSKEPLAVFLNVQRRNADDFVVEHPEDEMLYKSTAELVAIFKSHLHLTPPTLDRAGQHLSQPVETSAEFTDHGRKVRVAGTMYQLNIPFDGYMEFFYLTPSNSTSQRPKATIMQGMLRLYFSGAELDTRGRKGVFRRYYLGD
ncbi:hypothetical protein [Bradyrhizobium sp. ERR14]|uniref:hypothetical protein n=1 Tax=Bradyrhizobium sp. ERR14 TaxID=2663837 RepID=UPI00160732AF|nr:hypothetical protein [Bradyrhizobium sp. ERR14]MBB4398796.1 hypothetical protein [Bradyrhizobium sp. ERR14]